MLPFLGVIETLRRRRCLGTGIAWVCRWWCLSVSKGGFVREPLPHVAAQRVCGREIVLAGRVLHGQARPACPERRVSPTGRSPPDRVPADVALIS